MSAPDLQAAKDRHPAGKGRGCPPDRQTVGLLRDMKNLIAQVVERVADLYKQNAEIRGEMTALRLSAETAGEAPHNRTQRDESDIPELSPATQLLHVLGQLGKIAPNLGDIDIARRIVIEGIEADIELVNHTLESGKYVLRLLLGSDEVGDDLADVPDGGIELVRSSDSDHDSSPSVCACGNRPLGGGGSSSPRHTAEHIEGESSRSSSGSGTCSDLTHVLPGECAECDTPILWGGPRSLRAGEWFKGRPVCRRCSERLGYEARRLATDEPESGEESRIAPGKYGPKTLRVLKMLEAPDGGAACVSEPAGAFAVLEKRTVALEHHRRALNESVRRIRERLDALEESSSPVGAPAQGSDSAVGPDSATAEPTGEAPILREYALIDDGDGNAHIDVTPRLTVYGWRAIPSQPGDVVCIESDNIAVQVTSDVLPALIDALCIMRTHLEEST